MTDEGLEPPAFGSGIQRAAIAPIRQVIEKNILYVWSSCKQYIVNI